MTDVNIKLEPLHWDRFRAYGDVIEISERNRVIPINYGLTDRHHDLARIDVNANNGRAALSLFNSKPVSLPFQVKMMERHPLGSQAFFNTDNNPYVVIVAETGEFDYRKLRAFLAQANQGVNYHKGVWHHYCLGLNAVSTFVVFDRAGEEPNCDETGIPADINIFVNH